MAVTYTYNAPEGTEPTIMVAFTDGTITHRRSVNAVYVDGSYDADATEARVSEVAAGVENKIAAGIITAESDEPPPNPEG